ncbi:MAG: N-succinylarginine dihydrolase, partial [Myxococcota bacterium]
MGPTFNHGGFALGNLASTTSSGQTSHPRQAALQGLAKMRALHDLGIPQGVFPPHFRPELSLARQLGFEGDEAGLLKQLLEADPRVLAACYSASSMWTANAATVSPSADSQDGRVHLTPANLQNQLHRSIEAPSSQRILNAVFRTERFVVHDALPASAALGDEGAANHTRFCRGYGSAGLQFFVFGQAATEPWREKPTRFPARQTKEACEALVRLHRLPAERVFLAQQNPAVIDAGVFHNDVIAVGDRDVLFFHERAFLEPNTVSELRERFEALTGAPLQVVEVKDEELDVDACVATYLFNSQLVAGPDGASLLVCPAEVEAHEKARLLVEGLVADPESPIASVRYHDVRESMHGGGGPGGEVGPRARGEQRR